MPYTVPASFVGLLNNIALGSRHADIADTRRNAIVTMLSGKFQIIEATPIGSVVRGTALRDKCDLDVLVALDYARHIAGKAPAQLLSDVRDALSSYNTRMARRNGQAVTLYFSTWPNVDIVPARRIVSAYTQQVEHYEIPDATRGLWIKTFPQAHDAAIVGAAQSKRDALMMMRAWNRAHSSYLESFHVESMLLGFDANPRDWPWTVFQAFQALRLALDTSPQIYPVAPYSWVDAYLGDVDRVEAKRRLDTAVLQSREAWYATHGTNSDHERAIAIYRIIFGDKFPAYG